MLSVALTGWCQALPPSARCPEQTMPVDRDDADERKARVDWIIEQIQAVAATARQRSERFVERVRATRRQAKATFDSLTRRRRRRKRR